MHRRHRLGEADVLRDRVVAQFIYKIGAPIPLQARRINWIEHALQGGLGDGPDKVERRLLETANRFEDFLGLGLRFRAAPNNSTHLLQVEIFGEGRPGRNCQKREPAVEVVRRINDELAIPFHYFGGIAQLVEHWTGINHIDLLELERERGYDAEISTTTAKRPEQIRILIRARPNEISVCQHHVSRKEIVDGQSEFSSEMADSAAERESTDARC